MLFWVCNQCSPTAPSQLQQMRRPHLLQLAWSFGRTLETTPKKHLKRKKFPPHTQLWQLLSNFLLKLLSAQDVNFHFVHHFHFLQGLMREIIIFGARKLFVEDVELSLNFLKHPFTKSLSFPQIRGVHG